MGRGLGSHIAFCSRGQPAARGAPQGRMLSASLFSGSLALLPAHRMLPEDGSYASCSGCGRYGGWANSGEIDIMEIANTMQEVRAGPGQPTFEALGSGVVACLRRKVRSRPALLAKPCV